MGGLKKSPLAASAYRAIFEYSTEAIAILDRHNRLVEINPAGCKMLGLSQKQLINQSLENLLTLPKNWQRNQQQGTARVKHSPARLKVEYSRVENFLDPYNLLILREVREHQSQTAAQTATELNLHHQRVELFSEVTLKIRQSLQLPEILQTAVAEVQRILQADRVLIYQVFDNGTGMPIEEAVLPDFKPILGVEFPEEVFPADYRQLYSQGRVRAIADVRAKNADLAECLIEFMDRWQIKSKLVVPILQSDRLWGLLIAHQCQATRQWTDFEQELMQQLADQIGIALLQSKLLTNLEELVAERTAKLRQEISDRTQAQIALRHSEEQLRLIADGLPVLIAYVDAQQHYRFNNQAYQTWLGLSPQDIAGVHLLQVHGKAEYEQIQPYIEAVLRGGNVTYERDLILQDGCVHALSVTYIPHLQAQQQVQGFFALTSDISDRKAIERMKDEFISVISHELRTPLTSIYSSLKILATGKLGSLSQQGERMLNIADEQTERLVHLVNNVLDLQRIQSGKIKMNKQACQARELLLETVQTMQTLAQEQDISIVVKPNELTVWADRDYILQTLTNLVSNAIKFSPPQSTVTLSATNSPQVKNNRHSVVEYITFAVHDQGQGIPQDRLEAIFERFQQVDSSDSRKKGGTGLGLAICRQIVEGHGGQIWAQSSLNRGSTFYFTVPKLIQLEGGRHDK